jgi:rhomboid family GlyGly-CTERM serine protease
MEFTMFSQPRSSGSSKRLIPMVTLVVSALAGAVLMVPGWSELFVYDRAAIAAGEWWRLASGHVAHWNFDHLMWDVLMFAVLGVIVECRARRDLMATLILSAMAISATLFFAAPSIGQYRGLSGIDSALFTWLAVVLFREARGEKRPLAAAALAASMVGFAAKIGYELASGATLFVDSAAAGFTPLPLVHAVGGACGVLVAWTGAVRFAGESSWSKRCAPVKVRLFSTSAAKAVTCGPGISIRVRIAPSVPAAARRFRG